MRQCIRRGHINNKFFARDGGSEDVGVSRCRRMSTQRQRQKHKNWEFETVGLPTPCTAMPQHESSENVAVLGHQNRRCNCSAWQAAGHGYCRATATKWGQQDHARHRPCPPEGQRPRTPMLPVRIRLGTTSAAIAAAGGGAAVAIASPKPRPGGHNSKFPNGFFGWTTQHIELEQRRQSCTLDRGGKTRWNSGFTDITGILYCSCRGRKPRRRPE